MLRSAGARTSSTFDAVNETSQPVELLLGYGQLPEAAIRAGVRELAAAVRSG